MFMRLGAYYYPEQWPPEQWERDFDQIAAMGLQIVHMGEFAWYSMEPREGHFTFEWIDRCLELAKKRRLDVILCTPTAAPPVWLCEKHPEILPVDEFGRRKRPGGRRHYTPTAPALQDAAHRIVTALGEQFGKHPSIIGWQIDNEYRGPFDQSESTQRAFVDWLARKYVTIDALNRAWGNQFWNQQFDDFNQIRLSRKRDAGYGNPHHILDSCRFWSHAFAQFNRLQAEILRPRIGARFITTNFMPFFPEVNPADFAPELSLMSWDSYPVSGLARGARDEAYRLGDPAGIGFVHDQMASYLGRFALLELQPGHVNWSGFPALPYPGAIRLWIWTALAHGAEFITTYRFRQPRFGTELFHDGLVGTDGVTPSPGGREFVQALDEIKLIDRKKFTEAPGALDPTSTIGLLFDFEQFYCFDALPQASRWNQGQWLRMWYAAAARLGLSVKILHPGRDWPAEAKLIVVPSMQMMDALDARQFSDAVARGTHLLLTCRTALMDRSGQLYEGKTASLIHPLIGAEVEAYDSLPEDVFGEVELDGQKHQWGVWGDLLYAAPGTKVVAKYADQFYAGAAAVTQCRHATAIVTYCGVFADQGFTDALLAHVAKQAELTTQSLPPRVHLLRRGGYRVLLNYQDQAITAPAPEKAKFLIGSKQVLPAGVAVWEE
jgi:beta-galactosidase